MIAKKTKILALAVVGMMCAVAIVGAAYAVFAGEARTYNEGNNVDVGYMTLSPSGDSSATKWAAISAAGKEVFSTYSYVVVGGTEQSPTYTEKMAYYFEEDGTAGTDAAAGYTVRQIGDAKSFVINNESGQTVSKINFTATASGTIPSGDFKYFLKVTIGSASVYLDVDTSGDDTGAKDITFTNNSATVSVAICIGYTANVYIPTSYIGPAVASPSNANPAIESSAAPVDLTDVDFAFAVEDATS